MIELVEIDDEVRAALLTLRIAPESERYVGGQIVEVMADAEKFPEAKPWSRAVYADGEAVGYVLLSWDVEPDPPDVIGPWFLWKLLIDEHHQRRGLGGEVVRAVADLVRAQGADELLTSVVAGDDGPASFYAGLGFVPTGEVDSEGEAIIAMSLH
ncbi:MAG: GNAT family N-acetyltransferase [Actinomycetota bacterium]